MIYESIIIGSGPAGLTAAIYAARDNLKTVVVGGAKWGGQLMLTTEVENFPGFPKGILGPELMNNFKQQAERFGVEVRLKDATRVDFSTKPLKVYTDEEELLGKTVIVATGADTVWLGVPGEDKLIGKGVSSCAPCDAFFFKGKRVLVVGGGDSAMEEAITLAKFASEVIVVHRRSDFRASKIMQERVFLLPNVKVTWNTCVAEIKGENKVEAVRFRSTVPVRDEAKDSEVGIGGWKMENGELYALFPTDGVFVAIGHKPNTGIFAGQLKLDEKGYILKNPEQVHGLPSGEEPFHSHFPTSTSASGVFVAGDVHDHHYRQAITAASYGCMAALDVSRFLQGQEG